MSLKTNLFLCIYLAGQGDWRKGNTWCFIEKAVRADILELSAGQVNTANFNMIGADLTDIVAESVQWAREH